MNLSASPDPLAFGDVGVDTESTLRVKVTSNKTISANPQATCSDGAFTAQVQPVDESGKLFVVEVTCHPTQEKVYNGKLTIKVQNHQTIVSLSATGVVSSLDTQGSHLLLKIPDYADTEFVNVKVAHPEGIDPTGVTGNQLQSYLRLGTFDYDSESPAAKQLLQLIPKVNAAHDPTRPEGSSVIYEKGEGADKVKIEGTIFVDDVRTRPGDAPGSSLTEAHCLDHGLDQTRRQAESAKLYSRGGWRDHSDGNRVSTTWGDKVEVVRGNYKMVVMGRQNDPGQCMGWEATGAHIQDFAPGTMPGASFWLEWIDDSRYYAPEFHDAPAGSKLGATGDVKPDVVGQKGVWLLV
ncbi:MAG: hypothetical protein JRI23_06530, partial [Deltaproteobacteria bacterium]|nr:hypothetical protein [Deltaproteobacteria bacterium]MBW2531244.1 hypothetical protein [Deltaproteobacteria bacterium]